MKKMLLFALMLAGGYFYALQSNKCIAQEKVTTAHLDLTDVLMMLKDNPNTVAESTQLKTLPQYFINKYPNAKFYNIYEQNRCFRFGGILVKPGSGNPVYVTYNASEDEDESVVDAMSLGLALSKPKFTTQFTTQENKNKDKSVNRSYIFSHKDGTQFIMDIIYLTDDNNPKLLYTLYVIQKQ